MVHLSKTKKELKIYADRKYRFYLQKLAYKSCFQHDMAYGKSNDVAEITQSDKEIKH